MIASPAQDSAHDSIAERRQTLQQRYSHWPPRTLDQLLDQVTTDVPQRPTVVIDARNSNFREMPRWSQYIVSGSAAAGDCADDEVAC